jgi:hypothetical protein
MALAVVREQSEAFITKPGALFDKALAVIAGISLSRL